MPKRKKAGVDGLIIPDLPLDETADYSRLGKEARARHDPARRTDDSPER